MCRAAMEGPGVLHALPNLLLKDLNWLDVEMVAINATGALWMPMGNPANAFRTDFQVEGRPHSLAMPAMYTWGAVRTGQARGAHSFKGKRTRLVPNTIRSTTFAQGMCWVEFI